MTLRRLTARDFTRQPWKNGGGFTTELAVHADGGRPVWRVSVADIERPGPFSDFTGYERTLVLLEGDGLALDPKPGTRVDRPGQGATFDGGLQVACRLLNGPVRVLNVMVDRARATATVAMLEGANAATWAAPADWSLLYVVRGAVHAATAGEPAMTLASGDALRRDGPLRAPLPLHALQPGTLLADIRIRKPPPG